MRRVETGMKEEMEELYTEGVASHGGPGPCGGARKGAAEALDRGTCRRGYRASKSVLIGVPTLWKLRKATSSAALTRAAGGPCGVKEPLHARNLHAREPGCVTNVEGNLM